MNNLAIVLKKKRDDEARLARTSPQPNFNDDGTEQTWGGGSSYTLPQATESTLGGIKAATKTTESAEVKIGADGKLYAPAAGEAQNGLPAGGSAGQVLAKIDGTDYNAEWVDAPSGGGGGTYTDDYSTTPIGARVSGLVGTWSHDATNLALRQTNTASSAEFAVQHDAPLPSNKGSITFSVKMTIVSDSAGIRHAGLCLFAPNALGVFSGFRIVNINNNFDISSYFNGIEYSLYGSKTQVASKTLNVGTTYQLVCTHDFDTGVGGITVDGTSVLTWVSKILQSAKPGFFCYGSDVRWDDLSWVYS